MAKVKEKTLLERELEESLLVAEYIRKLAAGIKNPNVAYTLSQIKRKIKAHRQQDITVSKIRQWAAAAFHGSKEASKKRKDRQK